MYLNLVVLSMKVQNIIIRLNNLVFLLVLLLLLFNIMYYIILNYIFICFFFQALRFIE